MGVMACLNVSLSENSACFDIIDFSVAACSQCVSRPKHRQPLLSAQRHGRQRHACSGG